MSPIRSDVLRAVSRRKHKIGDKVRLRHELKSNGDVCTPDSKDPALIITRLSNGFAFFCHRCGEAGFVDNSSISPAMTKERLKEVSETAANIKPYVKNISLPYDFNPMSDHRDATIPWKAFHWIWKYSLNHIDMDRWRIGWSPGYNRVIIPIYEYIHLSQNDPSVKLRGWVGREVEYQTKEERQQNKVSKYITKKQEGFQRIFFNCPAVVKTNEVVLTEDIISAIKVWNALGGKIETIALLTTSVDNDLILSLREKKVFLWLDGDAVRKTVKTVSKLRDLGLAAFYMYTPKDPKDYNEVFIKEMWRARSLE